MGRVARYKRVKAIDPFAKTPNKPRKGGSLLPGKAPKKRKKQGDSYGGDSFTADDEYHPDGDVGTQTVKKKGPNMNLSAALKSVTRNKKERLSEFNQRVDAAASQHVAGQARKATKTAAKHRQRALDHKAKKATKRDAIDHDEVETHRKLYGQDKVRFGEVAYEPPTITSAPRKAGKLAPKAERQKNTLLLAQGNGQMKRAKKVAPVRQVMLAAERERAIQAYRQMKLSKQKAGAVL